MDRYRIFMLTALLLVLAGCTNLGQIRTDYAPAALKPADDTNSLLRYCSPGKKGAFPDRALKNTIEDYGTHLIGYVEYSDQGWEYNGGKQRKTLLERLNADLANQANAATIFVNIVFVHGWHHNAEDGDCNVNEFRAMVHQLSNDLNDAAKSAGLPFRYRINGIYVGWRGESVTAPLLRQASVLTRRNAAEHIAKGAVRELFADLRALEFRERARQDSPKTAVRTIVVGHSFGALIAYHSLSQALINDLAMDRKKKVVAPDGSISCVPAPGAPSLWPDFTVLINPAFEASRFEAVHDAAAAAVPPCPQRPKLVVVTADNDFATGIAFPVFRSIASIFAEYDSTSPEATQRERDANLHAIGFVDRYKTHRLELQPQGDQTACVKQYRDPHADKSFSDNTPVWVVGVTKDIVDGHDGFLYPNAEQKKFDPYLLYWLTNVYLDNVSERSDFYKLYEQFKRYRCVDKGAENEVIRKSLRPR